MGEKLTEIRKLLLKQEQQPVELVERLEGTQECYQFANGYGASVIRHMGSYGGDQGLFELAVLKHDAEDEAWSLCYTTPITNDVVGYLKRAEVRELLQKIQDLPEEQVEYEAWVAEGMPGLIPPGKAVT